MSFPFHNYVTGGYSADTVTQEDGYIERVDTLFGILATGIDYIVAEGDYVLETDPTPGEYLESNGDNKYTQANYR